MGKNYGLKERPVKPRPPKPKPQTRSMMNCENKMKTYEYEYDGMSLDTILKVVDAINEKEEEIEDLVGMSIDLAVNIVPGGFCQITFGTFTLWDSDDKCRDEIAEGVKEHLVECIACRLKEITMVGDRIIKACHLVLGEK